jgi:hypothetical protein
VQTGMATIFRLLSPKTKKSLEDTVNMRDISLSLLQWPFSKIALTALNSLLSTLLAMLS